MRTRHPERSAAAHGRHPERSDAKRRVVEGSPGGAVLRLIALLLFIVSPLLAQRQDSISALKANPQKYWNLEVTVAGLVGRADPALAGSQGGSFRLIDYTDTLGIAIESDELPAPGRLLRVRGIVVPSRDNATVPMVRERGRDALDRPSWLLWVIAVAATIALALGIALYFVFRRRNETAGVALDDAARPPVPIVIGGPVRMAPPPVFMPWAQPGARTSGAMMRPSLDRPQATVRTTPGAGTLPRLTPGGSPAVRQSTPGMGAPVQSTPSYGAPVQRPTPSPMPRVQEAPQEERVLRMDELIVPRRSSRQDMGAVPAAPHVPRATVPMGMRAVSPPVTQPFEPQAPKTEPFEYTGARLEVTEGPDVGRKVPIGSNTLLIGREGGRMNHLALRDTTVSRAQCRIVRDDTFGFVLENESGTNRTLVNGEPAQEPMALEDGAEIRMGSTLVVFRTN